MLGSRPLALSLYLCTQGNLIIGTVTCKVGHLYSKTVGSTHIVLSNTCVREKLDDPLYLSTE